MKATAITERIWWAGVNDHTTPRFEGLWPLPTGVSYNSYLIDSQKVALIDSVRGEFFGDFMDQLDLILGKGRKVDYLIVNHMEPDHSGAIKMLRRVFPDMVVVGNKQTIKFLGQFYGPDHQVMEVKEGDVLDLGEHKLQFVMTPFVHWPETMVTFESTSGILFSCDAFGSYGALDGALFDDEMDRAVLEEEARRYYATIVGRFGTNVQTALAKCKKLPIKMICTSHGPIHRSNVAKMMDLYDRMSRQETQPGAVVVYGTMYGNTARMAGAVAEGLKSGGLSMKDVKLYDSSSADLSAVIRDVWKYSGLVILSSCYYNDVYPALFPLIEKLKNSKVEGRVMALGGCYTWSKGLELKPLEELAVALKGKMVEPKVEVQSSPSAEQLEQCAEMGRAVARAVLGQEA